MTRGTGFTLLELLVVLVLLGLASAMVGPAALRSVERWRQADDVRALRSAIQQLPIAAGRRGEGFAFSAGDTRVPEAPSTLAVAVTRGWEVRADGSCTEGEVAVSRLGDEARPPRRLRVRAPYCHTEWRDE